MTVSTKLKCYLCGAEKPIAEMFFFASPALGPVVDLALNVDWLCADGCFDKARNSERIRGRIYAKQGQRKRQYKANLQAALQATESEEVHLATLPKGLRLTESDIGALNALDGDFSTEKLQDEATQAAAFRLLRNHKRLPFYKPDGTEIWDYDETKTRLAALEGNNG